MVAAADALLLVGCTTKTSESAHSLQLTVQPAAGYLDQPLAIRAQGLPAGTTSTVQVMSTDGAGTVWTSHADYRGDSQGDLDLSTATAVNGTYAGTFGTGLIASMQPGNGPAGYRWLKTPATFTASITTSAGATAATTFTRSLARPGDPIEYAQPSLATDGFTGFYATTTEEKTSSHPAVLLIGGAEGGNDQQVTAAALTLHGMSALSVAYFHAPGLPSTLSRIPLEYFVRALTWLGSRPGVDPDQVWVMGTSRGSEAALLLGSYYPRLVHGVIAGSPSNVTNCSYPTGAKPCVGAAWTLGGKALPYSADFDNPAPSDNPAAIIPVERIHGPVLVACGGADQVWRSCLLGQAVLDRRKAHHLTYADHLYHYPDAGHGIGNLLPDNITTALPELQGRTPTDDYAALEDVWPKIINDLHPS